MQLSSFLTLLLTSLGLLDTRIVISSDSPHSGNQQDWYVSRFLSFFEILRLHHLTSLIFPSSSVAMLYVQLLIEFLSAKVSQRAVFFAKTKVRLFDLLPPFLCGLSCLFKAISPLLF